MGDMRQISDDLGERVAAKLAELQGEQTDRAFAALLGCTREHWWNVKNGHRNVSYELLKRAVQRFPALSLIVMHDLTGDPASAGVR
jgi:hypothetical protein